MRNDYAAVDPKSLKPSGYNPNMLNDDQRGQLVDEIKRQGKLLKPIVCRDDDGQLTIIDGEHNWQAALEAGLTEVPVELVEVDGFEARRQTFVRNLSGAWHKVRLGRMFAQMLAERSALSNRDLAAVLGVSEGTVRNILLYARAAEPCAGREDCPDEDAITAMGVRQVRELIAWLEGLTDEGKQQQAPGAPEPEARILARLKRAWDKATEDERREFLKWTGLMKLIEDLKRELARLARLQKPVETREPANGEARNDYAKRGARIREARKARGLSARGLAQLAGLSSPNVVSMAELARLTNSGGPAAGRPAYAKLEAALGLTP